MEALLAAPSKRERREDGTPTAVGTIRGATFRIVYVVENDTEIVITLWKE